VIWRCRAFGESAMKGRIFAIPLLAFITLVASSNMLVTGSKNLKIAMFLWRGETEGEKGFKDGLKALGYSLDYTTMTAGQDRKELGRLLREELEPRINDFDYIYTFGTTASQMTRDFVKDRVPQIFNIVADPVGVGIVQSMEAPGGNISGASNGIPMLLQIETALKIIQFKRLGILFNPREKNSMVERQKLQDIAEKFHFELIDLRSPPAQDMLEQNLQALVNKSVVVDAVYLPLDSYMQSNAKLIVYKLRDAKVKSIGTTKDYTENGALIGVVPDYYQLGKAVASIVDRHQKGEKLHNIPIEITKEPTLMINKTTADLLQITIPEDILKKAVLVE
jgi:putative tryptophan/tyrosine transport system substrate-binding protein